MKNLKKSAIIFAAAIFLFPLIALAHSPSIVQPGQDVIKIAEPETSQAFYGRLQGEPQWFEFEAKDDFILYANILLPKTAKEKNVSVEIYRGENWLIGWLDADNMKWTEFHEPFAGDDYWQGEAYSRTETADVYRLKVYSKTNTEKYVLAVGSKESFVKGFFKTFVLLPQLKRDFFGVSPYGAYFNYIGLIALGVLTILAGLALAAWKISRKIKRNREKMDAGLGKLG